MSFVQLCNLIDIILFVFRFIYVHSVYFCIFKFHINEKFKYLTFAQFIYLMEKIFGDILYIVYQIQNECIKF